LETHSPHLIYRFGELVEEKLLNPNDVQVLIFDEKDGYSEVQTAYFDEDGMLKNWPVGFFQP
jgi:predicted ATPase